MFDRERKGYISAHDLHQVFSRLNESVTEEEITTMIRIAGVKSNDKINFKEFVEFFYKVDWVTRNYECVNKRIKDY